MLLGDVVDQLHHVHGLAHTGATEQTDLAALGERADQVDNLDAGFEQFHGRGQFVELRCGLVNCAQLVARNRTRFVDRATQHVHDATQRTLTNRDRNRCTGAGNRHATTQAVGRTEGNRARHAITEKLLDLEGEAIFREGTFGILKLQRLIHLGHLVARELNIHHRADTLNDRTSTHRFSLNQ